MFVPILFNTDLDNNSQTSIQFDTEYNVPVTNSFVMDSKEYLNTYFVLSEDLYDFRFASIITSVNVNEDEVKVEMNNESYLNEDYDFSIRVIPRQKIIMKAKISRVKYIKKPIFLN
jgi:hypothetical protein